VLDCTYLIRFGEEDERQPLQPVMAALLAPEASTDGVLQFALIPLGLLSNATSTPNHVRSKENEYVRYRWCGGPLGALWGGPLWEPSGGPLGALWGPLGGGPVGALWGPSHPAIGTQHSQLL